MPTRGAGYRPSAYLPGLPTENLPGPVLWTDEIRSLIDVLGRARWGDLGCIDSKDYLHITLGSQRDGVKGNVVVFGIGIAAGELVVGRTWMLWVGCPQIVGIVIVLLIDIVIVALKQGPGLLSGHGRLVILP